MAAARGAGYASRAPPLVGRQHAQLSLVTYVQRLAQTLWCAQLPLVVVVALPLFGMIVFQSPWLVFVISKVGVGAIGQAFSELGGNPGVALLGYTSGQVLVLFYGAPFYALLSQRGFASWLTVALVGVVPGVVVVLIGISAARPVRATGIGLLLLVYGLFVALATHATMLRANIASTTTGAELERARSSMYRRWSRVLALTAILGNALASWDVMHSRRGGISAIGFVYGTVELVAPFALAAFACLLGAYWSAPKPRSVAPLVEAAVVLVLGAALSARGLEVLAK